MTTPKPRKRRSNTFFLWTGFFLVLITFAIISTYATIKGNKQLVALQTTPPTNLMEVIIAGKSHYIDPKLADTLSPQMQTKLEQRQTEMLAQFEQQVNAKVDDAFRPAINRIPYFANWYYSLRGEYTRLASAVTGDMGKYLAKQLQNRVFGGLDNRIDQTLQQLNQATTTQLQQNLAQLLDEVQQLLQQHAVQDEHFQVSKTADFDIVLTQPELDQNMVNRQVVSGLSALGAFAAVTAGKGLGSVVVKQSLAKGVGSKSFQLAASLMAKTAVKTAAKTGGALESGAVGTAICSPSGPIAVLCGGGAAIVTWLAVDKVFLEVDEALNREEFEADIKRSVLAQRKQLKQQLKITYNQVINKHYQQLSEQIDAQLTPKQNFVPAKAIQK